MKITGFIPTADQAKTVVHWTLAFAGEEDEIEFLCYESWFGNKTQTAAKEALADNPNEIALLTINDQMVVNAVEDHLRKEKSDLLVSCQFSMPDVDGIKQDSYALINEAPCRTFITMYGQKLPEQIKKVLFFTTGYVHDRSSLKLVAEIGAKFEWKITVASVEEETGAKAGQSSEQTIKALIHDIGLDVEEFEIKVVVDRMVLRGIREVYEDDDLVVAGMDAERYFRHMEKAFPDVTAAIAKRIPPLRLKSFVEWLPRINPADHADLIHELRQGSAWGPDFIVMLGLAAAVSTLGLLQDSPAVVIGSMLLAPLMTPMMGLGLALAQANTTLMRMSLKSIVLGFFLTVVISFIIGYVIPTGETLPEEVMGRGSPNVLDLMIALFAAGAAAFAMARPNIVGAIAGVAIATALVPPACAIGISFAHGAFLNGFGASLLFFANLIAIIAASSFMFTALGITSIQSVRSHRRVAMLSKIGLIVILLSLFAPMSLSLVSKINEGKNVTVAYPVTRAVSRAVNERVDEEDGIEIMYMARRRSVPGVIIHLASKKNLPVSFADELETIVRAEMKDKNIPVQVVAVRSIWISEEE